MILINCRLCGRCTTGVNALKALQVCGNCFIDYNGEAPRLQPRIES